MQKTIHLPHPRKVQFRSDGQEDRLGRFILENNRIPKGGLSPRGRFALLNIAFYKTQEALPFLRKARLYEVLSNPFSDLQDCRLEILDVVNNKYALQIPELRRKFQLVIIKMFPVVCWNGEQ